MADLKFDLVFDRRDLCVTFDPYLCTSYMKHGTAVLVTKFGDHSFLFVGQVGFQRYLTF